MDENANMTCEEAARELGLDPEEIGTLAKSLDIPTEGRRIPRLEVEQMKAKLVENHDALLRWFLDHLRGTGVMI